MSRFTCLTLPFGCAVVLTLASFFVPLVGWVLFLPGLVTALAVQLVGRGIGIGGAWLDGDEVPGPVALGVGVLVNVASVAALIEGAVRAWKKSSNSR